MSKKRDALGDRMKGYEDISRQYLTRRVPVLIRLDGKAFHTFSSGMRKPFDAVLMQAMQETMQYLCANIQGCVFAYTQSDEITLVLTDYTTIRTDAWFGYNLQKMASVAASMATLAFNRAFHCISGQFLEDLRINCERGGVLPTDEELRLLHAYTLAHERGAMFDARAFSVPKDEVANCLIWRQQDAIRNSIEAVGHANFSQRELHGKNCEEIQAMLLQKGIDWSTMPPVCQRGACCCKEEYTAEMPNPHENGALVSVTRRRWRIDRNIPIFSIEREYVERWLL